jgi:hypothetical protein
VKRFSEFAAVLLLLVMGAGCTNLEVPNEGDWLPSPDGQRLAVVGRSVSALGGPQVTYSIFVVPKGAPVSTLRSARPVWVHGGERPAYVFWKDSSSLEVWIRGSAVARGRKIQVRESSQLSIVTRRLRDGASKTQICSSEPAEIFGTE